MAQQNNPNGLQSAIDKAADGDSLSILAPLEREGPIFLRRRISIDGVGKAAVWSRSSPVVTIHSARSSLRDIRVEYTGDDADACAIHLLADQIELRNVTVRGNILGIRGESGVWRYPHQLYLGKLEPELDIHFKLRLSTPVPCKIRSRIEGLSFQPESVSAGLHEIRLHIDGLRRDTLIFGVVVIETPGLKREIVVNGHAVPPGGPDVPMFTAGQVVWQPEDWGALHRPAGRSLPERPAQGMVPAPATTTAAPATASIPALTVLPVPKESKKAVEPVSPKSSRLRRGTPSLGALFTSQPQEDSAPEAASQATPVAEAAASIPPELPKEIRKRKSAFISPLFGTPPPEAGSSPTE